MVLKVIYENHRCTIIKYPGCGVVEVFGTFFEGVDKNYEGGEITVDQFSCIFIN